MSRTKILDGEQYETIIDDILSEHRNLIINDQIELPQWESWLQDLLLEEWNGGRFSDCTYSSISDHIHVDSPEEIGETNVIPHESPSYALDDLVYGYIRQDLNERFIPTKEGLAMLQRIRPCLDDFLATNEYESPESLVQNFNKWFVRERRNGVSEAASFDPIPDDELTPEHVSGDQPLDATSLTPLRAIICWLQANHSSLHDEHQPGTSE